MIKGIIFDCYGVLVQGSLGYLRILTPAKNRQAFDELAHASDRGYIKAEDYIDSVATLIGRTPDDVSEIIIKREVRSEEIIAYAKDLHGDFRTGLLSNVGRGAMERLFMPGELEKMFDVVTISSEIDATKPMPRAYEIAASQLGLSANECVMIDDIAVNVEGAKRVGMKGILFEDLAQLKRDLAQLTRTTNA